MMPEMQMDEEFVASWYIHLLGHELQSMTITPNITRKVKELLPTIIEKLVAGYKVDILKTLSLVNSLVIPTPLGLPLTFNVSSLALLKVDGRVQLYNLPSWSDLLRRRSYPDCIKLHVNIQPSVDIVSSSSFGVDLRWITAGASYAVSSFVHVPLNTEMSLDLANEQLQLKSFLPNTDVKLLKLDVDQYTFINHVPTTVYNLPFAVEFKQMEMKSFVKPLNFQKTLQNRLSGVEYVVTGHYCKCGLNWCPNYLPLGQHELSVVMSPKTATEFVIIKVNSSNVTNGELFNVDAFTGELDEVEQDMSNYRSEGVEENDDGNESGLFESVTLDPLLTSNPYRRQVLVDVSTSDMERSLRCNISFLLDRQHWFKGQLIVQVVGNTGHAWKVKFNEVFNFMANKPSSTVYSEEFLHKMKFSWTLDGQEKYVKCKIIPGDRIVNIYESLRQHDLDWAASNLSSEYKHKYTLDAEISRMDRTTLKYIVHGTDFLKRYLYRYVTVAIPSHPIHNKLIIAAEFIPIWEKMTMVVKSPHETDIIVGAPFYFSMFLPARDRLALHDQPAATWLYTSNVTGFNHASPLNFYFDETWRECFVHQHGVMTFDGLTVTYRPTQSDVLVRDGCEVILTQDCSGAGLFAVLSARTPTSWKLRFLVPGQEIKYVWRGVMSVTVNGDVKNFEPSQEIVIREVPVDLSSETLYKIEKIDDELIKLECLKLGLTVTTNFIKSTVKIRLSAWSMLQGQLCGLCGNYNQQTDDEFVRQSKHTVRPIDDLLERTVIPSDTCSYLTSFQHSMRQSNMTHDTCMEKKRMTIRRQHNGLTLICESVKPIQSCSPSCRPVSSDSWTSVDVCFTCRTEPQAQPFTAYRPSTYSESTCSDYEQRVNVPVACTAA